MKTIQIQERFLRSIRIENDIDNISCLHGYVITPQVQRVLRKFASSSRPESVDRAWTITGPYGTGKSAFILFLSQLLKNPDDIHNELWSRLKALDSDLSEDLLDNIRPKNDTSSGYLPVMITGRRISASLCILEGLYRSIAALKSTVHTTEISIRLKEQMDRENEFASTDIRTVINLFEDFNRIVSESGQYSGVLMVIDELGKIFEYSNLHPEQNDIFILQELAEITVRSKVFPVFLIGVLHQSFDNYGQYLDAATRNEWAKIQGRFNDVAFIEPPEQMMRLIAQAIEKQNGTNKNGLKAVTDAETEQHHRDLMPSGLKIDEFRSLIRQAAPLHPSVLVALPYLFKRFAQNERSLFSYLSSNEHFGFLYCIKNSENSSDKDQFIRLHDIYDYFITNFAGYLRRQLVARRWIEASGRIEGLVDPDPLDLKILKTIAILSVIGEISHLQSTEANVLFALINNPLIDHNADSAKIRKRIKILRSKSIIAYRRFNNTYRLWEGSDVDIEERLTEGRRRSSGQLSLAEIVRTYIAPKLMVARRHSYRKGALRFIRLIYIDSPYKCCINRNSV